MNSSHRRTSVLWLTKFGFSLFINGQSTILSFPFNQDSVSYLDIIDEDKFITQLEQFIKQNNLIALDTYFIIAPDALLEKEFVKGNDEIVNEFIEVIPYEDIFTKKIQKENSILVIGFNARFYNLINTVWANHDSKIISVLPYLTLSVTKFDQSSALLIIKKADNFKNESMVIIQNDGSLEIENNQKQEKQKSILPVVLPIFIFLIIVLILLVINTQKSTLPKSTSPINKPTRIIIPTPTILPAEEILASPSAIPTL